MFFGGHVSWLYLIFGVAFSSIVSFISFKLNFIKKDSELLYLSLGFYRHFLQLYCQNFIKSCGLIFFLVITKRSIRPLVYSIEIDYQNKFNPALMLTSFNISAGLFCIDIKEDIFYIHAIDEKYFNHFDLFKMKKNLPEINDDNLV